MKIRSGSHSPKSMRKAESKVGLSRQRYRQRRYRSDRTGLFVGNIEAVRMYAQA